MQAFECLLNLELPNFGRENWKSNVRKKVCVHEKYKDMEEWTGPETADVVYEDKGPEFVLTNAFSEYLPKDRLREELPSSITWKSKLQQKNAARVSSLAKPSTEGCVTDTYL